MDKVLYAPSGASLDEELLRVAAALAEAGNLQFEQLSAEPEFPQPFVAVATNPPLWDPLGAGVDASPYLVWYNPNIPGWQAIGSGDGSVDLSNYYTKSQVNALLDDKISDGDLDDDFAAIDDILDDLTSGLQDAVDDITSLETNVDSIETLVAQHTEDIADLTTTYGNTASSAASAAAAAASEAAAIAAEAAAIIAQGGAEAARDSAVIAQVAAEDASDDATTSASAASTSATSAAAYASDAGTAATAAETSRVEAVAAANQAVNAAQGGVTIDAAPGALFTFDDDAEGWVGTNPAETWDSAGFINQASGTNPVLTSPTISVNGNGYHEVVARIRRNSGSGWEGRVRYSTSGHGFSGSFEVVISDPLLINGEWQIVSWNFSGLSDWTGHTITGIEVQLGSNSGGSDYDIDWIGVGNNLATLAQAAATSASNAATSATSASSSASSATSSATSASTSAGNASTSASAAATSAASAASSSTSAASSASAANTSKLAAQTAESGAQSAQTAAVTASNNASTSASQAATSATNAANSASASAGSASAASGSASSASTSATNAAVSATSAQASQVSAASQATNAANSATAAATSASSASTSATNAAASASASSGSATQAATSAANASTSATQASNSSTAAANASQNASTSATNAANSAATATTQASNASASAANASTSASLAAQALGTLTAVNPLNVVGNTTGWSVADSAGTGTLAVSSVNVGGRALAAGVLTSNGNTSFLTDLFNIDPAGIYEVRLSILKNQALGQVYIGIYEDPTTNAQGILNQALFGSPSPNPYWGFYNPPVANQWYDHVFYLCGSAVDPAKVPDHIAIPSGITLDRGSGMRSSTNRVRLRVLNWSNAGTSTQVLCTNVFVSRIDNQASAALKTEQTVRASQDTALASSITSLTSTVNGHTSSINSHQSVLNGISATYTLQLNANGYISGMTLVNNGVGQSSMVFLTDRFAVAQQSGAGGIIYPFTIGNIGGVPTIGVNGNLVVDGSIISRTVAPKNVTIGKKDRGLVIIKYASVGDSGTFSGNGVRTGSYINLPITIPVGQGFDQYPMYGSQAPSLFLMVDWGMQIDRNPTGNYNGVQIELWNGGTLLDWRTAFSHPNEDFTEVFRIFDGSSNAFSTELGQPAAGGISLALNLRAVSVGTPLHFMRRAFIRAVVFAGPANFNW